MERISYDEKIAITDSVSIVDYCSAVGFELVAKGRTWVHPGWNGLSVSYNGKMWNNFSPDGSRFTGGGVVQFARWLSEVESGASLSHMEAVNQIISIVGPDYNSKSYDKVIESVHTDTTSDQTPQKVTLPEANDNYRRVFAYLNKTRGIDSTIISNVMHDKLLYESKDHHNCVFVCKASDDENPGCTMHGTYTVAGRSFKQTLGGQGFVIPGKSNTIRLYESTIDLLSHLSLIRLHDINKYERVSNDTLFSMNGLKHVMVHDYISRHPLIDRIVLSVDNDDAGHMFCKKAKETLEESLLRKVSFFRLIPYAKDWNDDLLSYHHSLEIGNEMLGDALER